MTKSTDTVATTDDGQVNGQPMPSPEVLAKRAGCVISRTIRRVRDFTHHQPSLHAPCLKSLPLPEFIDHFKPWCVISRTLRGLARLDRCNRGGIWCSL
jgi:hypothetical protein